MPLPLPRRRPALRQERQADLPAPGPFPAARPPRTAVVIFIVVLIVMAGLLVHGCSLTTAVETASAAGVLAAGITSRLAGIQSADN